MPACHWHDVGPSDWAVAKKSGCSKVPSRCGQIASDDLVYVLIRSPCLTRYAMPIGCLFDDSRNEVSLNAVLLLCMMLLYFYAAAEKIGIMILFLSSYIGYLRLR
jgi:hypothetical protein